MADYSKFMTGNATPIAFPPNFYCGKWKKDGKVIEDGSTCCSWHFLGQPKLKGQSHPMYDYQVQTIDDLEKYRYLWILKSPKLGMTELFLRYIIHQSMTNPEWQNGQVAIVVGTQQGQARRMIDRCRGILGEEFNYESKYDTRQEFYLNSVNIMAYPAMNIDAIRSQPNMKFILIDEAAFFSYERGSDSKVRDAAEHYTAATDAYIVFLSTAGDNPSGFFYDMEGEDNSMYHNIYLIDPEKWGIKKHPESGTSIYTVQGLDRAKLNRSYNRNYLGEWGYSGEPIFDRAMLEQITINYDMTEMKRYPSVLGVDPAYGRGVGKAGAKFGMLGAYLKNGLIYTCYLRELKGISELEGNRAVHEAMTKGFNTVCIDSAGSGLIADMKKHYHVKPMHFNVLQHPRSNVLEQVIRSEDRQYTEAVRMTDLAENLVSTDKIRIHKSHTILLEQLRSIQRNEKGLPDKKRQRFDVGDAFQMCVYWLHKHGNTPIF